MIYNTVILGYLQRFTFDRGKICEGIPDMQSDPKPPQFYSFCIIFLRDGGFV